MLNPPFLPKFSRASRSPAVSKGGCVYYPLWLAWATGAVEKAGHEARLVDAPASSTPLEEVEAMARAWKPEVIVLDTVVASFYNDLRVAEKLKEACPDAFTVMVGTHASARPRQPLEESKAVDAVCKSEYDYTLLDLARELERASPDLHRVQGLAFRDQNGAIEETGARPWIPGKDLEEASGKFKWQSRVYFEHGLQVRDYFYPSVLYPEVTVMTGRGCPFRCTFCMWPQSLDGHIYRYRSAKDVVDEFAYIQETFPEVKDIMIEDDTFTVHRPRVREICEEILDRGLEVTWTCNARADVDYETLKVMKEAGCRLLCVGFESGVQEILDNIKKGTRVERIRAFMKNSKKAGVLVHGCFMLGNQGETRDSIARTVEFAKELNPDTAQFFPIMVYPGTESYEYFKKKGYLVTEDYSKWVNREGDHNTLVSRPGLSHEELVRLCDEARRAYYLRPAYLAMKLKQAVTQPREIPRLLHAAPRFARYLLAGTPTR